MRIKYLILVILLPLVGVSQYKLKPAGKKIKQSIIKPATGNFFIEAPVKVIFKMSQKKQTTLKITGYKNIIKFLSIKTTQDGTIKIKWNSKANIDKMNYPIINIFSPYLTNLILSKTAYFYSLSPLQVKNLTINVSGAGSLKIPDIIANQIVLSVSGASNATIINLRQAKTLKVNLNGASDININGNQVDKALVNVDGASDLKMEGIKANSVKVNVSGTSDAYIRPINEVNAMASGESEIIIFGKPPKLTKSASGLSKIIVQE